MNNIYLLQNSFIDYNPITAKNLPLKFYSGNAAKANNDKTIPVTYTTRIKGIELSDVEVSYSKETLIPINIVKNNSSLESIVIYLKDSTGLKYSEIARLLGRDPRTIWVTYSNAKKKGLKFSSHNNSPYFIPASIFTSRNFSILESIVFYLKNNHSLTINQISDILGKNYQTINTVYRRALQKLSSKI